MDRLKRLQKLENALVKPAPKEIRLLSSFDPDFERQLENAQAAGVGVIVLRALEPLPHMKGNGHDAQ